MRLLYGGDYNPEQWPEQVRDEDMELMRRAGVNAVTVGVFAWSALEPAPGRYEFGRLDQTLDRLADNGIAAVLATPTASPPPWFSLAHPEALPVTADGVRLSHGSRDTYCASAPAYREAARRIAGALGERYRGHPALAMWHVHNEYGTACHCDLTAGAFRVWLRHRYGDLGRLNDAWTTAFWGQGYGDWAEIRPPRATQYLPNPAQVLDFRRFTSDELLAAYAEQRDVLRAATPGVPVTTNFVLGGWVPVDHARWAREVDLVAIDHYPSETGVGAEEQAAFAADLARGWARHCPGGTDWLLMETAPNLIYTADRMHTKEPGRMTRHSLAAVARGSRGVMFFQWRAPVGGAELFHSALVPHAGPDSRVFREAVALGDHLDHIGPALASAIDDGHSGPSGSAGAAGTAAGDSGPSGSTIGAGVAIGYDEPSAWALRAPGLPSTRLDHLEEAQRAHRALWRRGLPVEVIGSLEQLGAYRMIVLPGHYLMSDAQAGALRAWVTAGGRLVVTFLTGVADEHGRIRTGGYPGALRDLLGIRVEEFHPLAPEDHVTLSAGMTVATPAGFSAATTGDLWRETVHLAGADPVAVYADGGPAITRHDVGAGTAWYLSTRLDPSSYEELLLAVAASAGLRPASPDLPPGLEVVRRGSLLFALNHTGAAHDVPADGVDLLSGERVAGSVRVAAGGAAVIQE